MYLDKASIQKVLFSQMGLDRIKKSDKNKGRTVIRRFTEGWMIPMNCSATCLYSEVKLIRLRLWSGDRENYEIFYDPVDQRVICCLRGSTTDPQRFRTFVETLCSRSRCPEAYLTVEEIADLLGKQMEESKER